VIYPCEACQKLHDGWVDYGPPIKGWIQYMNPDRSLEAYKARQSERRELVRRQLDSIAESCRAKGCIK
jgi:hypothetical protein